MGRYLCRGGEGCKRTEPRNFCSHISWLRRSLENLRPHPWYWIRFRLFCIMLIRPGKHNVLEDYLNTEVVKDIIFLHFMWSQMIFLGCWQPFGLRNPHHTWYLLREPRVYPCKNFLAGVNFYRFNAKNWHFRKILRGKVAFFYRFNAKNWRFSV